MKVIIRKITLDDANVSWKWRNDPEVWRLTGREWNNIVTKEIEKEWIEKVLEDENSIRFAICVGENKEYIGNVQLTDINEEKAVFHIFIGNKNYWGKGIGFCATRLIIKYAKDKLKLNEIYLTVKKDHIAAIKTYNKNGFTIYSENDNTYEMVCKL